MARVPKRALHLMEAEVNRLMQLTKNAIIPISFVVPRRSYLDFHAELYPDTASGVPSMTAEQWFAGANHPVSLVKLDPKNVAKRSLPKAAGVKAEPSKTEEKSQEEAETKTAQVPEVVNKAEDPPKKVEAPKEDSTKAVPAPSKISNEPTPKPAEHKPKVSKFHGFRVSKFKHLSGKPSTKSQNIENLKNYDQSLCHESDGLQAYFDLVAYPIAGPGGQIAVVKLSEPKRLPDTGLPVLQNPSPLLDFSMDPFDNHLIAAACEDSVVRIWKVPEDGLVETMDEPAAILAGKVFFLSSRSTSCRKALLREIDIQHFRNGRFSGCEVFLALTMLLFK
ncbi:coronin-7-like [Rhopilema esculentum]|uniref:coronin-7-like n=1 Tax=Rhopilema esculentum TaxID=499914 RepID=UPI0031E38816